MSDDDGSIGFSPRRVTSDGGSRAAIVATATAVLLALAVLKPWAAFEPAEPGTTSTAHASSPQISRPAAAATASPVDGRRLPRRQAIERAIEAHNEWGVRLVVDAPQARGDGELLEHWLPATPARPGSIPSLSGGIGDLPTFAIADGSLRLVGFTAPPEAIVDELSFVVGRPLGRAATLQVTHVRHRNGGDGSILLRSRDGSPWRPGVYQFRFKLDGRSTALTLAIFEARARF